MDVRDSKRQRILYYEVPDETRFRSPPDASACTTASPLDDEVPPFLQNLLFKDPQSFHGHTFYLLEGGAWDDSAEAQLLFVRQCYPKMFNFVNGLVKNHDLGRTGAPKRAVVSGTAGIGKSLFGLYAARKWFDADKLVVIWFGQQYWAFSKKKSHPVLQEKKVGKETLWFCSGSEKEIPGSSKEFQAILNQRQTVVVRDPGYSKTISILQMKAFALYDVSTGNVDFEKELRKFKLPPIRFLRYMDLWDGIELIRAYQSGCFALSPLSKKAGLHALMEGNRRYGGSARNAFGFADACAIHFSERQKEMETGDDDEMMEGAAAGDDDSDEASPVGSNDEPNARADSEQPHFQGENPYPAEISISQDEFEALDDNQTLKDAILFVTEQKTLGEEEAAKAKAIVYHRVPLNDGKNVQVGFASSYIARKVVDEYNLSNNAELQRLVAALGAAGQTQSPYGVLYEIEMHKMLGGGSSHMDAFLLGCHEASRIHVRNVKAKQTACFGFNAVRQFNFPGHSLENFCFASDADVEKAYIQPIATNFPTHDSFVLMKASTFFEGLPGKNQSLDGLLVLVGLQMTVSGSGDVQDKPSHIVRAQNLTDHLKAIKVVLRKRDPNIRLMDDVVTVFISPTESCRKMQFMEVTTQTGGAYKQRIPNFGGMAPQYYVVKEDPFVAKAIKHDEPVD